METLPIFRWLLRLRVFELVAGVGFEPTTLIHVLIYARDLPRPVRHGGRVAAELLKTCQSLQQIHQTRSLSVG